ncbi:uncharacterized protein [Atheta coriaria]|uniref:uncharacterized protein n=1 Tax=Dalotia coriaria TaxID=877792 RepID=UPI0031F45495
MLEGMVHCASSRSTKMGAGNSKEFDQAAPRRKSRRKFYGVLKHNFDLIEHKLKPDRLADDEYEIVHQLIEANKNELLAVVADVQAKPKYKQLYDECMATCDRFAEELRTKRIPSSAPSSPGPKKRKKKKMRKERKTLLTPEEESFAAIHAIRAEMVPLRDEVLTFKGQRDDRIYHFLQESFHRYVKKLCAIELHERVQLKYELRIAIAYAQESQEVLDEICAGRRPPSLQQQLSVDERRVVSMHQNYAEHPTNGHFVKNTTITRKRSKSMGDYLHKTGDADFCGSKKSFSEYPDSPDYSSDSDYAQTSDFSDGPKTPHSINSTFTYNFKVTSI